MNGEPPPPRFPMRQPPPPPLQHHIMVYSMQPNLELPPSSREHGQATTEQTSPRSAVEPPALSAPKALYHVLPLGHRDEDQKPLSPRPMLHEQMHSLSPSLSLSLSLSLSSSSSIISSPFPDDLHRYRTSRMSRFFRTVNLIMSAQLRQLMLSSCNRYLAFLRGFMDPDRDNTVDLQSLGALSGNVPLFLVRIVGQGYGIMFEPLLEEVMEGVQAVLDSVFISTERVPGIGVSRCSVRCTSS